ncbi:MAG: tetratricopeptide repeat protein [Nitrospirae bacterium]|nr:MAG: tetratricopeptide repeat protein [Nitrospirota bacterium]
MMVFKIFDMCKISACGLIFAVLTVLNGCVTLAKTPLGSAVESGDVNSVKELLAKGSNACEVQDYGLPAFGLAATYDLTIFPLDIKYRNCSDELYKVMLDNAYETLNKGGNCPQLLDYAAGAGCNDIVRGLLEKGYDPNAKSGYGNALGHAAFHGHISTVEILLNKGADLNSAITSLKDIASKQLSVGLSEPLNRKTHDKANQAVKMLVGLKPIQEGWSYYKKGNYAEAINAFNRALEVNPRNGNVLDGLGWAHYYRGNFNEAISYFNKVLEYIEPNNKALLYDALLGKTFSYLGVGDGETAISIEKKRKETNPDYNPAYNLSLIYYLLGDKEKAWEYRGGRGMVGLQVKDYNKGLIRGVEAVRIVEGGPAAKAGLLVGDIILKLDGAHVSDIKDFVNKAAKLMPRTTTVVRVLREGLERDMSLSVASAETLMEENPLIAPIIAKKKGKAETAAKQSYEVSSVIEPAATGELPPSRSDTYAVVVGIDYKGRQDIPNLQYASQDAKRVYDVLTDPKYGGVPKENSVLLLNEKATRSEMISALRKIKNWDGYVYVYFSGHGAPKTKDDKILDGFLVPYDAAIADAETMEDTSIKVSYLRDLMSGSQSKGLLVALDACFTGGGKSIVPKGGKPLVGMMASSDLFKSAGTGKVMITSSAANQQSWEDETELKSGIFSHYFLEALRGKGGKDVWVKVDELADYIKENVPKAARKFKGADQTPHVSGKGDFAVTRNWERSKVADIDIARNKLKAVFEKGIITAEQLSKAMDEMKSSKKSKTLEAFLEGKIDEKKFGELY